MSGPDTSPRGPIPRLQQIFRNNIFHVNFYRVHMAYFIITILIASVIVYGSGIADDPKQEYGGRMEYIDALFLCTSAMTATGLATVNLNILTAFQQAVLAILIIIGNVVFVSTSVVVIRRYFFRKKLAHVIKHSKAGQQVKADIDEERAISVVQSASKSSAKQETSLQNPVVSHSMLRENAVEPEKRNEPAVRLRRQRAAQSAQRYEAVRRHHQTGRGSFPAPWQIPGIRRAFQWPFQRIGQRPHEIDHHYFSFKPNIDHKGRIHALNEHEREELGGVEYRALSLLMIFLPIYLIGWLTLGTVFLVPYSYRSYVKNIVTTTQTGYLVPGWWSFFLAISTYGNCGLNLLNSNFQMFQSTYYLLIVVGALNLVGNTQFPVLLRFFIWATSKVVRPTSRLHHTLSYLLHHPRRCFIYLFPSLETWYLFGIQIGIDVFSWFLFEVLNLGIPYVMEIAPNTRAAVGLFLSLGLRTGGFYPVSVSFLAPALQAFYIVVMYISSFPIIMALRQTNTYEEKSIGLDSTESGKGSHLSAHLQSQLAYDLWFLVGAWFLICIVERTALMESHPGFLIFNILFEVTSAYGTVGLSTGVPYDAYSLSGAFHKLSKVIMLFLMIRGRHRGLPLAIDRSILIPGEELFHRMDEEYSNRGGFSAEKEKELRRVEEESGAKEAEPGKALQDQDPYQEEKSNENERKQE